ncbi:MAG: hypothetical protein ACK55Z_24600 [bacterium]
MDYRLLATILLAASLVKPTITMSDIRPATFTNLPLFTLYCAAKALMVVPSRFNIDKKVLACLIWLRVRQEILCLFPKISV